MTTAQEKFQSLLRELFQFDCADLDFGIYRIMNYKRDVIEKFITQDLPKAVANEMDRGALAEQSQAAKELTDVAQQIKETLGKNALDADGNLAEAYHTTPLGKKYQDLKAKAAGGRGREALETSIFNHLYTFFSRYYQDGDFISKRRYSKRQRYAIPYNGEEVTLYWANYDQYYVKTAEYFHDYTWKGPNGVAVHFKLVQADVEQNNVKGDKRFFLPRAKETAWDEKASKLLIPFEYRPLTEQEEITYGKKKQQEKIIAAAIAEIPKRLSPKKAAAGLAALTAERRNNAEGQSVSYLEHHLRQYTRRNTSDFFIHKDLKGFLSRELDFYLKNEVLNLDEIEAAGEDRAEGWFQLMRVIKQVGNHIIDFLAQIEEFQKMLWEKRKFITETQYCITVGNIHESFYPEIAACEPQWAEWKDLEFAGIAAVSAATTDKTDLFSSMTYESERTVESLNKGWHSRGYLPHFDAAHSVQFITFRLHDSVPAEVIERWKQELHWTEGTAPDSKEAVTLRKRIEQYEDAGHGICYLRDERIARLVQDALLQFDGQRYRLIAWCIMPNHVHLLIEQMPGHSLSKIVQSWKSFAAHKANELLGRSGPFWMPDYFDRFIRDEKHFSAVVEYIRQNPVKAGLVDEPEKWAWSGYPGNADVSSAFLDDTEISSVSYNPGASVHGGRDVRDPRIPRIAFLKDHPTLMLDTKHFKHFDAGFVDRLLASFDDLDEMTDGLLVHSENWQALNLMLEKYRERVKCIYIDPPYNTGNDEFLYRDNYQHSSWLAMMVERLALARECMTEDGPIFVSIDDGEQDSLHKALESMFGRENFVNNIIWQKKFSPQNDARWLSDNHDFLVTFAKRKETWRPGLLPRTEAQDKRYQNPDKDPRGPWMSSDLSVKTYSPEYDYPITTPSGRVVHPPPGRCWFTSKERMEELIADNRIWFGPDGNGVPRLKRLLSEIKQGVTPLTIWTYKEVGHNQEGKQELKRMLSEGDEVFGTPKPTRLLRRVITVGLGEKSGWVLDYFSGSGTTGHAVINLNREDGGNRKFILVEMGEYFDTVLLPRIKKVTFSPEWKNGKPKRMATPDEAERSPRIVKYIRLESYEDALNNIEFDDASGQQAMKFDDYLLKYMLQWEIRHSATLLNVEKLARPFSYKLHIHADLPAAAGAAQVGGQTQEKIADVPETFNYLLGLHVQTRRVYNDDGRRYLVYRGRIGHRQVAVIWRETEGWQKDDFERDKEFVAAQKLTEDADEVFVNGDSFIPNAKALEPVFKARMFASVEV